jgi:hypothetical protein
VTASLVLPKKLIPKDWALAFWPAEMLKAAAMIIAQAVSFGDFCK